MSKKIEVTSSKNNRALIDKSQLERYLEMGYTEGWPEDDVKEVKETVEQLDAEEADGDKEVPEVLEVVDDKPEVVPPEVKVAE